MHIEGTNLFLILELDPDEPWSDARFEKRLGEMVGEWSRLTPHPTKGSAAKASVEKVPKLREMARNEADRATHAVEAKAFSKGKHEESVELLRESFESVRAQSATEVSKGVGVIAFSYSFPESNQAVAVS